MKKFLKDELIEMLHKSMAKSDGLRQQIYKLEYDEKYAKKLKHVGNYYKRVDKLTHDYINCFYVYGVNEDNCDLKTLSIFYYLDKDTHYTIDQHSYFNPDEDDELFGKVKKISKKEFMKHYNKVLEIINNIVNKEKDDK